MRYLWMFLLCLGLAACGGGGGGSNTSGSEGTPKFIQVKGEQVVQADGAPVLFKGVQFMNWSLDQDAGWNQRIPVTHHTEEDFARIHSMGMNLVRFGFNYKTLESDSAPYQYLEDGWAWFDQNIAWAKKHGVYLILDLHVPQGGYQSLLKGDALWTNEENQKRLIAMWKAIAERYKNEPQVLGFDLINEPCPTQSVDQWKNLAQKITDAIREVDKNHLLVVEHAFSVKGDWNIPLEKKWFKLSDDKVVYSFHFYEPYTYTHQLADWADIGKVPNGNYPGDILNYFTGETIKGVNKEFLRSALESYMAWGKAQKVPMLLGEFGLYRANFDDKGLGGYQWASDMLDLLKELNLPFVWHAYHEDGFGIYRGDLNPIDVYNANDDLIALFREKLGGSSEPVDPLPVEDLNVFRSDTKENYPIKVYVPKGMKESGKIFPSVFVLDAEWNFEGTINRLGAYRDKAIVVGIFNNSQRNRDFVPAGYLSPGMPGYELGGHASEYLNFIRTKVVPALDERFPSIDPKRRILYGGSYGGLFTSYALLADKPTDRIFKGYVALDASLFGDNTNVLFPLGQTLMAEGKGSLPVRLYCGGASAGNNLWAVGLCNELVNAKKTYGVFADAKISSRILTGTHGGIVDMAGREGLAFLLENEGP